MGFKLLKNEGLRNKKALHWRRAVRLVTFAGHIRWKRNHLARKQVGGALALL
jgi:hypothetical protein